MGYAVTKAGAETHRGEWWPLAGDLGLRPLVAAAAGC